MPTDHSSAASSNGKRTRAFSLADQNEESSTVIVGAGIIGCASAYYLSRSETTNAGSIHIVESSPELFASASGKSGGFVVSDWFGPPAASLGALSFRLHQELANEHDGLNNWGYSRSTGASLLVDTPPDGARGEDWLLNGGSRAEAAGVHEFKSDQSSPAWLTRRKGDSLTLLSEDRGVAQVILKGVRLHHPAEPVRIARDADGAMAAIRVRHANGTEHRIPCTRLLIAAGAWTPRVFDELFPYARVTIPISPLAGHSLVVKSPRWTKEHEAAGCHAVFTTTASGLSPEIFSRVGAEIYVAGLNDAALPLPARATDAVVDPACAAQLREVAHRFLGHDGTDTSDLEVLREGLCFRPVTPRGYPLLARVADGELGGIAMLPSPAGGVFVAAGHGPWGISHSLGTGKVMAEMLEGRELSADVGSLGL